MQQLAPALSPLGAYKQFVAWKLETRQGSAKPTKVPYSPITGRMASSTNPADWGTFEQAVAMPGMSGVGFVFTEQDPFFFLDIDNALQGSSWSMLAQELCARFAGAMVEVSQSGTGLHIIGSYSHTVGHRNKNTALGLELYTKERFVALTGTHAQGSVSAVMDAALSAAVAQFFTREVGTMAAEWTTEPDPAWRGPEDDLELLDRIFNQGSRSAAAAFGGASDKVPFIDLWTANADELGKRWPPNNLGDGFDHSNADQSMANQLAFWTGKNCERIERIMRLSGLARAKWDTHGSYLQNTILKAAGFVQNVYVERTPAQPTAPAQVNAAGKPVARGGFLNYAAQQEYFSGCIYVTQLNKVLTPAGDLLDQARFDVHFAGFEFVTSLDGKKTVSSAWEAYLKNQNFPAELADRLCFRPEHGTDGIIMDSGKRLANTYRPAETEETEGDPSPFLKHVARMLPDGRDAEILLTYMASVKQHPGMKAQWWPVVQGAQGNGKSSLLNIMSFAVGAHYSHLPNTEKMIRNGSNFNGWIEGKLFLGLDEIHGNGTDRRAFFNGFKTTVTNLFLPVEGKGIEEATRDNRVNGMIVVNDRDGVPITDGDRRYAALFCAQQTRADLLRDGMTDAYFSDFYDWLKGRSAYGAHGPNYGLRVINHHLARRALAADVDPAQLAIHAPMTTSTQDAIAAGLGRAEQEIMEAIEEERQGFSGGWVSSIYLDRLLDAKRIPLPNNKRREAMQSLGYDWHPALLALSNPGRVTSVVSPDGGKPRLYVKMGSLAAQNLTDPASVAKAYGDAQLKAGSDKSAAGQAFSK